MSEIMCTLCADKVNAAELSGVKIFSTDKQIPYQLCFDCCKKLNGLSPYSPIELKKRRDFWEDVWARLAPQA